LKVEYDFVRLMIRVAIAEASAMRLCKEREERITKTILTGSHTTDLCSTSDHQTFLFICVAALLRYLFMQRMD
jgi:hypothetical protein